MKPANSWLKKESDKGYIKKGEKKKKERKQERKRNAESKIIVCLPSTWKGRGHLKS